MLTATNTLSPTKKQSNLQPILILKPNTPKKIKYILAQLSYPVPKYINQRILCSQQLLEILGYISVWTRLQSFYIVDHPQISQICLYQRLPEISFPVMTQLYLQNIKLDNFQPIQFINAPNLKALYLMKNHGRIIKSLVKTKFSGLNKIQIDNNIGHLELTYLSRMKMCINGKLRTLMENEENKKRTQDRLVSPLQQICYKIESIHQQPLVCLSQKLNKVYRIKYDDRKGNNKEKNGL